MGQQVSDKTYQKLDASALMGSAGRKDCGYAAYQQGIYSSTPIAILNADKESNFKGCPVIGTASTFLSPETR
jgi:hypothetical protein